MPTPNFMDEEQHINIASHAIASAHEALGAIAKVDLQRVFDYVHPKKRADLWQEIMDGREMFSAKFEDFKSVVGPAVDRGLRRLDQNGWQSITSVRDAMQPLDFIEVGRDAAAISRDTRKLEHDLKELQRSIDDTPYQPDIIKSAVITGIGAAITAVGAAALAFAAWPAFTLLVLGSAAACAVTSSTVIAALSALAASITLPGLNNDKQKAKMALRTFIRGLGNFKSSFTRVVTDLPEAPVICPISENEVEDAVETPAGHVYERAAITEWIESNGTDPVTKEILTVQDLKQNEALAKLAQSLRQAQRTAKDGPENESKQADPAQIYEAQRERFRACLLRLKTNLESCGDSIDTINLHTELRVYRGETDGQLVVGALQPGERPADLHDATTRAIVLERVIAQKDAILGRLSRGALPTDRFLIGDNIRGRKYRKKLKEELEYWDTKAMVQRSRTQSVAD